MDDPRDGAPEVLSVGHSNLSYDAFLALLRGAGATAVADVRSAPYSRRLPHFDARELKRRLVADGIAYVFLGKELGGRPSDSRLYREGIADYEAMARMPSFSAGLDRLVAGAGRYRIAMMCSEGDPTECHRCLLVGRALKGRGVGVSHVMQDARVVRQEAVEQYLLALSGQLREDLFRSPEERLSKAYGDRMRKVAYREPRASPEAGGPAQGRR